MFPWFTAIEEDHERMENPRCVQWREIADCLRNLTGPIRESLGENATSCLGFEEVFEYASLLFHLILHC
jgi:hypothetical protein